jgi:hypothetical protein
MSPQAVAVRRHLKKPRMRFCLAGARQVAIATWRGNDAEPWHLLTGAEHADAASLMAAADVTGRTTLPELSGRIRSSRHWTVGDLKNWADYKMASSSPRPRHLASQMRCYGRSTPVADGTLMSFLLSTADIAPSIRDIR